MGCDRAEEKLLVLYGVDMTLDYGLHDSESAGIRTFTWCRKDVASVKF